MRIAAVGISHRRAPVASRERVHLGSAAACEILDRLAGAGCEAGVLATCNRTEIYLAHPEPEAAIALGSGALSAISGLDPAELEPVLERYEETAAAEHLFRVAAGLESLVLGEAQILGQVRRAYAASLERGTTGSSLNRLFHQALAVGKRVRTETALAEPSASVPAATVELARRTLGSLTGRSILVLGAGATSSLTTRALSSHGVSDIVIASRTPAFAARLVQPFGGEAIGLDRVMTELARVDAVIACSASPRPLLTASQLARAVRARAGRPLVLFDIAVPRDLDPCIRTVDGCELYDLDDLQLHVADTPTSRHREIAKAEAFVAAALTEFEEWQRSVDVAPLVSSICRHAEEIRATAIARATPKLANLSSREISIVETLTAQIVSRLIHPAIAQLKDAAVTGDVAPLADAVHRLFELDSTRSPRTPEQEKRLHSHPAREVTSRRAA